MQPVRLTNSADFRFFSGLIGVFASEYAPLSHMNVLRQFRLCWTVANVEGLGKEWRMPS